MREKWRKGKSRLEMQIYRFAPAERYRFLPTIALGERETINPECYCFFPGELIKPSNPEPPRPGLLPVSSFFTASKVFFHSL
jgi:hypothetical protein